MKTRRPVWWKPHGRRSGGGGGHQDGRGGGSVHRDQISESVSGRSLSLLGYPTVGRTIRRNHNALAVGGGGWWLSRRKAGRNKAVLETGRDFNIEAWHGESVKALPCNKRIHAFFYDPCLGCCGTEATAV